MIDEIRKHWWWVGINPVDVVCENDFGNLIVKDANGRFWRICPEELECKIIAQTREDLDSLNRDQDFLCDWHMTELVDKAKKELGPLQQDQKYCFKIPGVLGGKYDIQNFTMVSLSKLVCFSGDLAKRIKDVPDGEKIDFKPIT